MTLLLFVLIRLRRVACLAAVAGARQVRALWPGDGTGTRIAPFAGAHSLLNGPRPAHGAPRRTDGGAVDDLPPVRLPIARGRDARIPFHTPRPTPSFDGGRTTATRAGRRARRARWSDRDDQTGGAPWDRDRLVDLAAGGRTAISRSSARNGRDSPRARPSA